MRIRRLDLLRYGHFSDQTLELEKPAEGPDIHILLGLNEAGKSTAKAAVEDLLFGIPNKPPRNFLHANKDLRIGAVLESHHQSLQLRRRKGTRDTLLKPDESRDPALDAALASLLGGVERSDFERMFSLDHARLLEGGREILEARGEVGQILFAASAGISDLRQRLAAMEQEAGQLWARRSSKDRKYYQAMASFDTAKKNLREYSLTTSQWRTLKGELEQADKQRSEIAREIEAKDSALRKLARVRRVYRNVAEKARLDRAIKELGEVPSVPEDAREQLDSANGRDHDAELHLRQFTERLDNEQRQREALRYDESILQRAQDIERLHERRIEARAGKSDLPIRRAELSNAEAELRGLATDLEWDGESASALINRIPPQIKIATAQKLLAGQGAAKAALDAARAALDEACELAAKRQRELQDMAPAMDVSLLRTVIRGAGEASDIGAKISAAETEARIAENAMRGHLHLLQPPVADVEILAGLAVPPGDAIAKHRNASDRLDAKQRDCQDRIDARERELTRDRQAHERLLRDEDAVSREALDGARERRDEGWSLIRRRYIEQAPLTKDEQLALAGADGDPAKKYEAAVKGADDLADSRFANAAVAAEIAVISRNLADGREQLEMLRQEKQALAGQRRELDAEWQQLWSAAPFDPLSPDAMAEWSETRRKALDAAQTLTNANGGVTALGNQESKAKAPVIAELAALGTQTQGFAEQPLGTVLNTAEECLREHNENAQARRRLEADIGDLKADVERRRGTCKKAEQEWADWRRRWHAALDDLGLDTGATTDVVASQIEVIGAMREKAAAIRNLRHQRIEMIEQDVAAFNHEVEQLVAVVAPDLAARDAEDAVLELENRLTEAARIRDSRIAKDEAIADLEKQIDQYRENRQQARVEVHRLAEAAGIEDSERLGEIITKADDLRNLQTDLDDVNAALESDGDGLPIPTLVSECAELTLEQAESQESQLTADLKGLRERDQDAQQRCAEARREYRIAGGGDAAAQAATDKQSALADMRQVAEQYVRVQSAVILLRWAIDRYRHQNQAPLLARASRLFATMTDGSFETLQGEFDERDRPQLIGVRPDGAIVGVEGMSVGTVDQLYLALRVAAVENSLERGSTPLPFIADDLFTAFDDRRAAAGLDVLGHLAGKTQVLFFTHHHHLVEIARKQFGDGLSTLSLNE